jgi:hypothetical protein
MVLVFAMLMALTWSIQRADWFEGLNFLLWVAFYSLVAASLLGLSRLSVAIVLPVSAVLGAWVVLACVGGEFHGDTDQLGRVILLRGDILDWLRIVVNGGFAPQLSPYALGFGVLMWTTSFMAGYALFRHHRVIDTILLIGVALIANMSATFAPLFGYLIFFAAVALLLWLRVALVTREEGWRLRHVTEHDDVPGQIMTSGVAFIVGSIFLAWVLTTVAVAAPLTGVWNNLDGIWSDVRNQLDGVFGGLSGADSRIEGTSFGASFRVRGKWNGGDGPVMTVAAKRGYYMRTITYDVYTGRGWTSSKGPGRRVEAGARIFPGYTPERPLSEAAFTVETVQVEVQQGTGRNVFTPGYPTTAFLPLIVNEPGGQPLLGALLSGVNLDVGKGYQITADVSTATEAMLAGAGTNYPPEVVATYLGTKGVTPRTGELAHQIVTDAKATDPYHQAKALADYLRSNPRFTYTTVASLPSDPDRDLVDFFLFDPNGQRGYCEYFATTMAVMARTLGLPARVAVGYAPGEQIKPGIFQVRERNRHLWAEVFFPGYGWQIFEATKSIPALVRLPGVGVVPPVNLPTGITDPGSRFLEGKKLGDVNSIPSLQPVEGGFQAGTDKPTDTSRTGNAWIFIVIASLILLVAAWRLLQRRHRFRFLAPGDRQWQRLAFAADRAGVAQRPSETVYEYASWLEVQLPRQRGEIHEIADGKVWHSYSGRSISSAAIARLERAWSRLQLPLVWLAVRRRVKALLRGRAG